jgi:hypothetical protein
VKVPGLVFRERDEARARRDHFGEEFREQAPARFIGAAAR